jgi:hypothetical protein
MPNERFLPQWPASLPMLVLFRTAGIDVRLETLGMLLPVLDELFSAFDEMTSFFDQLSCVSLSLSLSLFSFFYLRISSPAFSLFSLRRRDSGSTSLFGGGFKVNLYGLLHSRLLKAHMNCCLRAQNGT